MVRVGGDDHPPSRHFAADQLGRQVLPAADVLHLLRRHALPCEMHLRHVGKPAASLDPLCAHVGPPRGLATVNPAARSVNTPLRPEHLSYPMRARIAAPAYSRSRLRPAATIWLPLRWPSRERP